MQVLKASVLIISISILASYAHAEVLCLKSSQAVNKGKVNLASALKVEATTCAKGYVKLLDTAIFRGEKGEKGDTGATGALGPKGEKGDPGTMGAQGAKGDKGDTGSTGSQGEAGLPALSNATCTKRSAEDETIISNTERDVPYFELTCETSEYAFIVKRSEEAVYSNDWSYDANPSDGNPPDTDEAGTTVSSSNTTVPNLYDNNLFPTGFKIEEYIEEEFTSVYTGTLTYTRRIEILCCLKGD